MARTAVVILNWNTRDFLGKYIPVLLESTGPDVDIVVADSGSTDGSMELLEESFPSVKRIPLGKNYGFTGGYNRAFEALDAGSRYEYFVLLNSDIEVTDNWLSPLVTYMDTHPECGACAPKLHSLLDREMFEYAGAAGGLLDRFGYPYCKGRVLGKLEKDCGQYGEEPYNVMWATGACLLVRTALWEQFGGLDDRFFAHMEEIDLCWRLQLHGNGIVVVPESLVYHLGGGTLPKSSPQKLMLNYRNNILLLQNNLARTFALEALEKGTSVKRAARKGVAKAKRRIFERKILDGCSAMVYLLTFKWENVKAVAKAHSEASRLGKKISNDEIEVFLEKNAGSKVEGFTGNVFIKYLCQNKR